MEVYVIGRCVVCGVERKVYKDEEGTCNNCFGPLIAVRAEGNNK